MTSTTKNMFKERNKNKKVISQVTELLLFMKQTILTVRLEEQRNKNKKRISQVTELLLFMKQTILTVRLEELEKRSTPVMINIVMLSLERWII